MPPRPAGPLLRLLVLAGGLCLAASASAQERTPIIFLWSNGAPGYESRKDIPEKVVTKPEGLTQPFSLQITDINNPSVTVFLPPRGKASGAAVVILPGGGHRLLSIEHEGWTVAQWLSDHGVAGFVLKYRLAHAAGSPYRVDIEALQDAQRAIRLVRSRAAQWDIDPARVGIMGFSAGGELAGLASLRYDAGNPAASDPIDRMDCKPAFQALIYPGQPQEIVPTKDSPPVFLAAGNEDRLSEGAAQIYLRFRAVGVPAELHIYRGVGHGFGYRPTNIYPYRTWLTRFYEWLDVSGFLGAR